MWEYRLGKGARVDCRSRCLAYWRIGLFRYWYINKLISPCTDWWMRWRDDKDSFKGCLFFGGLDLSIILSCWSIKKFFKWCAWMLVCWYAGILRSDDIGSMSRFHNGGWCSRWNIMRKRNEAIELNWIRLNG